MKVRISAAVIAVALATTLGGCSRDKEVMAALSALDDFTKELVSKVEDAKDPGKGVDAALDYLEEEGDDVKEKLEGIKDVSGFQVSEETMDEMTDVLLGAYGKLAELEIKYMERSMSDDAFRKKIEKLSKSYNELLDL